MGFCINLALPLAGLLMLSACQGQDQREPITRNRTRSGKVTNVDSKCDFTPAERSLRKSRTNAKNDAKSKADRAKNPKAGTEEGSKTTDDSQNLNPGDCLNLAALVNCLKGADNEVARLTTVNIKLFELGKNPDDLKPVADPKVLPQLLNQSGEIKLLNVSGRMDQIRSGVGALNAVTQTSCEKVTLKDSTGALRPYTITLSSQGHIDMQHDSSPERIVVSARRSGRILIQRTWPMTESICGKKLSLLARETQELSYGSLASMGSHVSKELVQLLVNHTEASSNVKNSLNEPENKSGRAAAQGRGEMVPLDELSIDDAYSRAMAGQFKNLECGLGLPTVKAAN